jgi:dienelactone hydrolase
MNASSPDPTRIPSTDIVLYDPTLPHISVKAHLDAVVDKAFKNAMTITLYETKHLSPEIPLKDRRLCQILPPLTGPYTIGRASLILDIPKDYSSRHESNEKIGIEIFAPTRNVAGNKVLMQMRPGYRAGNPPTELTEQQIHSLHSHASDLDHLDQIESMSILVFSHGMGVDPIVYRPLVEELASHGFIVLNLNHPASSNHAPFSQEALDGHAFDKLFSSGQEMLDKAVDKMAITEAANIRFVVEQIRTGKLEKLPKNCGPQSKVILGGHSLGGASSIIASRDNPEIAGCIDLDGRLEGSAETRSTGLTVPVLVLCSEPETQNIEEVKMAKDFDALRENSSPSQYTQKMIKGVKHMDFTMHPILDWLVGGTDFNGGLKAHTVASKEMLYFMKEIDNK